MNNHSYFELKRDRFSCILIEPKTYASLTREELASQLSVSLTRWQEEGIRGVWARIDLIHSHFIPVFVENGFDCHHAQASYIMMKKWLSLTEPGALPPYASHHLGVGGFVVNDNNQLLVVQEKFSSRAHWKLPGGYAELGENIGETAEREVFEETGIKTEFQCVIAFRHQHSFRFGCSDFYFICLLKPLTQEIKKCDNEIAAAKWLDLDTYISHPDVSAANRHFAKCYLEMVKNGDHRIRPTSVRNHMNTGYDLVYSIQYKSSEPFDPEAQTQ